MYINEFFGNIKHNVDIEKHDGKDSRDVLTGRSESMDQQLADDLYWFILDHDELHKTHFMPLAKEISQLQKSKKFDHGKYIKKWMPMVKAGCLKFYKQQKMEGHPNDIFTKKMRKDLCYRLADQHHRDIEKNEYTLGEAKKHKNKKIKEVGQAQMAAPSGPYASPPTGGHYNLSEKQRLDPKCWKGYRKSGTKLKGGVRVNNCVKVSEAWELEITKLVKILENKI